MKFNIKSINLKKHVGSCIIVGIFEYNKLSLTAQKLNKISNGYINNILKLGDIEGKLGQKLILHNIPNVFFERILLIGCGKEEELNDNKYKKIIEKTIVSLNHTASVEAIFCIHEINVNKRDLYWKIRKTIEIIQNLTYDFNQFKSKENILKYSLCEIIFNLYNINDIIKYENAIKHGTALSFGIKIAKDLSNTPPNVCNPYYITLQATNLAKNYNNIKTNIINKNLMKDLGMNSYLSVGNGSQHEPLMSIIEYQGLVDSKIQPIVLIGKGLTFDSGGISIKPSESMDEMKYDMCGAAAVYGVMCILAQLKLPLYVIGILASCENMLDSLSLRPGDILKTMSGKTVEVLNTDAEGRLVLCDVLTYVERFNPEIVIDIATLTGACAVALGNDISGLFANNQSLANELLVASEESGDHSWQLPLFNEYQEQLNSKFADITNIGSRYGGAITAACFLSNFTNKYHWAHIDIAGTAWCSNKNKGATGRPIPMILQFLLNRSIKSNV